MAERKRPAAQEPVTQYDEDDKDSSAMSESQQGRIQHPSPATRNRIEDYVGAAVMAALALITFANVLVRYFSNQSFAWTEEISVFLMIVLAMVGGSAAFVRQSHIRIEFFAQRSAPARREALARLSLWLGMLMFGALAILSARLVWDDYRFEETSPAIGLPQWWYSVWLPILSTVIFLRLAGQAIRRGKSS